MSYRRPVPGTWRAWIVAALGFMALAGCSRNPVTGRPEMVLVSTEAEVEAGREQAVQVEALMGFADLASARSYVQRIGKNLAAYSPRSDVVYTFDVVDMAEPNAFALPGGPVYVAFTAAAGGHAWIPWLLPAWLLGLRQRQLSLLRQEASDPRHPAV